jgi:hypothetical protein
MYTLLKFRLQISEYSSKLLLSIYLGKSSTPMLMASPGKGTQPKNPSEILIKFFKRKSRGFS